MKKFVVALMFLMVPVAVASMMVSVSDTYKKIQMQRISGPQCVSEGGRVEVTRTRYFCVTSDGIILPLRDPRLTNQ